LKILGIILIVLGLVALATGGISWTRQKKVVDLGPIQATAEKRETLPLSPVFGGASLIAGIALLVVGGKKGA
jgi:uncharacterized membrane protein YidH (DUF202 family)